MWTTRCEFIGRGYTGQLGRVAPSRMARWKKDKKGEGRKEEGLYISKDILGWLLWIGHRIRIVSKIRCFHWLMWLADMSGAGRHVSQACVTGMRMPVWCKTRQAQCEMLAHVSNCLPELEVGKRRWERS